MSGNETTSNQRHFYPRPPQGGRLHFADMIATHYDISIHALRKEGDAGLDAR